MNRNQFKSLLSRALDNDLSPEKFAAFEQHLASSPEARALYLETADVHNLLDLMLQAKAPAQHGFSNVVDVQHIIGNQRRRSMRIAAMAAVAVLFIGLVSLHFLLSAERTPILSFGTDPGTEFSLIHGEDNAAEQGMTMEKGSRLRISRGTVELTFASGVRSIITAPADISLQKDDTLFVDRGAAWFEVPEKAIGFTVKTDDLTVVDLGTEFGVLSRPDNHDEVHVFKGKVRVTAMGHRKESTILVANEARRDDPIGRLETIEAKPSAFLKSLSGLPPYLHWSFDESDKYEVKGVHPAAKGIVTTPSPSNSPPLLVEGKFGTALSLDGNQQGLATNWEGIYGSDRPLSTAVWVRIPEGVDMTGLPAIVGWGIPMYSKAKWKVQVTHNKISDPPVARISIGGHYYDGQTRLDDNRWHHIAAVYHGRNTETGDPEIVLYIDGRRESLTHHNVPLSSNSLDEYQEIKQSPGAKPMSIGKGVRSQEITFRGLIDELYIFDGAISQEAIRTLVNLTKKQKHKHDDEK